MGKNRVKILKNVCMEFDEMVCILCMNYIMVEVFEIEGENMFDVVFLNNWLSIYFNGLFVIYFMYCENC